MTCATNAFVTIVNTAHLSILHLIITMTNTFTSPFNTPTPPGVDVVSSVKQRCIDAEIEQRRRAKIVREEILDTLIADIDNPDYIWNISDRD
jgi:hypothetical protein